MESVRFLTRWATFESMTARWEYTYKIDMGALYVYLDGNVKDNAERLEGELVHGVDPVEVVEDEVEDGSSGSRRSVQFPRLDHCKSQIGLEWNIDLVDLCRRLLCLGDFVFDLSSGFLGVLQVLHQCRVTVYKI